MDRFEQLLRPEGIEILRRLNPGTGGTLGLNGTNCPATAAALARYLATGSIEPAVRVMSGQAFEQTDLGRFIPASLNAIIASLTGRRHGQFRIVAAESAGRHHQFGLLNISGRVYYVDAYTVPPIVSDNVRGYLGWANHFEYYSGPGYRVRRTM